MRRLIEETPWATIVRPGKQRLVSPALSRPPRTRGKKRSTVVAHVRGTNKELPRWLGRRMRCPVDHRRPPRMHPAELVVPQARDQQRCRRGTSQWPTAAAYRWILEAEGTCVWWPAWSTISGARSIDSWRLDPEIGARIDQGTLEPEPAGDQPARPARSRWNQGGDPLSQGAGPGGPERR